MVRHVSARKDGDTLCQTDCIQSVFRFLNDYQARYVVLSSEALLGAESARIELAFHPKDQDKVALAFRDLRSRGYRPVQCLNYVVKGYHVVFTWAECGSQKSIAIDVISEHREENLTLLSGEELVRNRRRKGDYWVPDPRSEFLYLFSKKVLKGRVRPSQADRLAVLVEELGEFTAQRIAARLLGPRYAPYAVWCCVIGDLTSHLVRFRKLAWFRIWALEPWNPIASCVAEALRRVRQYRQPTGIFVAFVGRDEVSPNLTDQLRDTLGFCFRSSEVLPFCETVRWLRVQQRRTATSLVITDRGLEDVASESRSRLMRLLARFAPKPDLTLIVKTNQEESRQEKTLHRMLVRQNRTVAWVDGSQGAEKGAGDAVKAVLDRLESRFLKVHYRWLEPQANSRHLTTDGLLCFLHQRYRENSANSNAHAFAALPKRESPKWLIPLDNSSVARKGLEIFTPWKSRARLYRSALTIAAGTSPRFLTARPVQVDSDRLRGLKHIVSRMTGEVHPAFAISIGARGKYQKITVQAMKRNGEVLGFAKIPMTAAAEDRARREAEVLSKLGSYPHLDDCIPKLLWAGDWQDTFLLFEAPVRGLQGPEKFGDVHFEFLHKLHRVDRRVEPGDELVAKAAEEWAHAEPAMDPQLRSVGAEALAMAESLLEGVPVPCGMSHGDFTPWNTKVHDGKLKVFDWEAAEFAPVWWDVLHFYTQTACLLKNSVVNLRIPAEQTTTRGVYLLYLLHTIVRIVNQDGRKTEELPYRQRMLTRELRLAPFASRAAWQDSTRHQASTYETR